MAEDPWSAFNPTAPAADPWAAFNPIGGQTAQYDQYGAPTAEFLAQAQGANVTGTQLVDKLAGTAGAFAHGQSLGVGDELDAAAKATLAPVTSPIARALGGGQPDNGDTWQQRYEHALTTNREAAKKFAAENP